MGGSLISIARCDVTLHNLNGFATTMSDAQSKQFLLTKNVQCLLTSTWCIAVVFHRTNTFNDSLDDLFRRAQISKNRRITYQCGKEVRRKVF